MVEWRKHVVIKLKIWNSLLLCWLEQKFYFVASSFNNTRDVMYKNRITNLQIKFLTLIEFSQFVSYSSKVYWTINDESLAPYIPDPENHVVFKKIHKNIRSN